jgi:hypothetical protein
MTPEGSDARRWPFRNDFQRVPLVFAIATKPIGWVNARALVPLAGEDSAGELRVTAALLNLCAEGWVDLRQRRGTVMYRRTEAGLRIGQRLLRDRRFSFARCVSRSGQDESIAPP